METQRKSETESVPLSIGGSQFHTTHWSVVLAARGAASPQSEAALQRLCRVYWYPLYFYVRRRGYQPADAEDLAQSFFEHLLQNHRLENVQPKKGRFRSFLLASINNFLANEWDHAKAQKRGGRCHFISLDAASTEARYLRESISDDSAERMFERRWAIALLDQALSRLREECASPAKAALFEKVKRFIPEEPDPGEYATVAAEMGWTRSALAVAVHRFRHRYRELVRQEVVQTVSAPEEVEGELRALLAALK